MPTMEKSERIPVVSDMMKELDAVLEQDLSYVELMEIIHRHALGYLGIGSPEGEDDDIGDEEDGDEMESESDSPAPPKLAQGSPRMIIDDCQGKCSMLDLLHTIPRKILKSLILNTIAYDYTHDPEIKQLLHEENNCRSDSTGQSLGLTGRDWARITKFRKAYFSYDPNSEPTMDAKAIEVVIGIDMAMRLSSLSRNKVAMDVYSQNLQQNGKRLLDFQNRKVFFTKLKERHQFADQTIEQIQAPIYPVLHPKLSASYECGIRNSQYTPILKIWEPHQLKGAEALLSWITGAAFEDGGFNNAPAGVQSVSDQNGIDRFEAALEEVWVKNPWAMENQSKSGEYLQRFQDIIEMGEYYQSKQLESLENNARDVVDNLVKGYNEFEEMSRDLERQERELDQEILFAEKRVDYLKKTQELAEKCPVAEKVEIPHLSEVPRVRVGWDLGSNSTIEVDRYLAGIRGVRGVLETCQPNLNNGVYEDENMDEVVVVVVEDEEA
ncbi:hypothetical protein HYALB_00009413 [Hymenoscyphus albidus]|uniref:Uncharacterized protein n=1 Tax=Hymenoscyphus albidus TaxID=595503 RepID=A0A9N9LKL4_9HELO|nr:hypothetical protein HYALB_00009413 [Hymenoscyphus albidus]